MVASGDILHECTPMVGIGIVGSHQSHRTGTVLVEIFRLEQIFMCSGITLFKPHIAVVRHIGDIQLGKSGDRRTVAIHMNIIECHPVDYIVFINTPERAGRPFRADVDIAQRHVLDRGIAHVWSFGENLQPSFSTSMLYIHIFYKHIPKATHIRLCVGIFRFYTYGTPAVEHHTIENLHIGLPLLSSMSHLECSAVAPRHAMVKRHIIQSLRLTSPVLEQLLPHPCLGGIGVVEGYAYRAVNQHTLAFVDVNTVVFIRIGRVEEFHIGQHYVI